MQYSFGTYTFDLARYELLYAGQPVALRPKACELLAYLLTHRDHVVSKEELLAQVWSGQYVGDAVLHNGILAVHTALHETGRTPSGSGDLFPAWPRHCPPSAGQIPGTAHCYEPRSALAAAG